MTVRSVMSKHAFIVLVIAIACASVGVQPASAGEFDEFGIESVAASGSSTLAGIHADLTTSISLNHHTSETGLPVSATVLEDVKLDLPPGLVGNATNFPTCSNGEFLAFANCPVESQIGIVEVLLTNFEAPFIEPIYNLEPAQENDGVARFGFFGGFYIPVFINATVRTGKTSNDYGVTATVDNSSGRGALLAATTTIWGVPADPVHDSQRLNALEVLSGCTNPCFEPDGERASGLPDEEPFLTNPSACQAMEIGFSVTTYQLPGTIATAHAGMESITGCESLDFQPTLDVQPTNQRAGAPTGLDATVHIPQVEEADEPATSTMRAAKVVLPQGMTINPSAANGLEACSDEQVGFGEETQSECPDASKLGEATIISPALPEPLHGAVYQRTPAPGNQFRLWLVTDEFGFHVKLPGVIHTDKATGQLTTEFLDTPQLPVEEVDLRIFGGDDAPLKNPDACGTYQTSFEFTPWSGNPPAVGQSPMTIDRGCGSAGFNPRLDAGVTNPVAGAFTPIVLNVLRSDGEENLSGLKIDLPRGLLAKLKGVGICPETSAASGACPDNSKIGSVFASVGAGPEPLGIPQPGKSPTAVYLAGPYKGAPYSVIAKVPAQAGPFDLGNVVVRSALKVDPETAQATVESDPLPQFVEGVPALYRTIHVAIDRPEFAINPTNCEPMSVEATVNSAEGAVAHPSDRFQVGACGDLGFKPRLSLRLRGKTERTGFPALHAVYAPRPGDANLKDLTLRLPRSEFIEQGHFRTICTRVQFASGAGNGAGCPEGSVYGHIRAYTPLLDKPLEGPVYLRSSSHNLPDVVLALRGQVDAEVAVRIDSLKGGLQARIEDAPDVPISRAILTMRGGQKGLFVNSRDICAHTYRARLGLEAHNGRAAEGRPALQARCPREHRHRHQGHKHRGRR